ncbi:MAG: hypothetical protein Q9210_007652 [Variospora velana]
MTASGIAAGRRRKSEEAAGSEEEESQDPSATRYSPEEEAVLLSDSHAEKAAANELFKSAQYSQAISTYGRALASVPNYLEYEIAVLKANIAACHLKLSDWKAAIDEATKSLEALDRLEAPATSTDGAKAEDDPGASDTAKNDEGCIELAEDEEDEGQALEKIAKDDRRKDDIRRIRAKALMRRARARSEQGGWANLQGALEGIV